MLGSSVPEHRGRAVYACDALVRVFVCVCVCVCVQLDKRPEYHCDAPDMATNKADLEEADEGK